MTFHPRWDQHALDCAGDTYHVVATDDLANYFVRQGLLATHPLVRRSYILEQGGSLDGPGLVYHEGYSHNFVDCELSVLARSRGVYVFCRDARVEHRHPAFKSAQMDSTYEYGMRDFARDRALFCDRMAGYSQDPLVRRFIRAEMQLRRRA
ncbi:MAG: hypothetical protein KatS3mg015_2537 [Fimbriimonadales bacterium]|nr:MAG: hypothetical protein KatS3mg015_2537 [Fimbriimonadales bacterium]